MDDLIRANGFGPFHCQGVEILRRVFVTVRDRNWREISPTHWNCKVDEAQRSIAVEARHESELVDFRWQGTLEVSADGRIVRFNCEGEVQRTMDVCRLGLIVLHPVESMVGARITARGPGGQETLMVAPTIAPQPIIEGVPAAMMQPFSSLKLERADLGSMELHFAGDLFELEDQRNWGDASFKTYCTPLKVGFPREILKGTCIAHSVELRFSPSIATPTSGAAPAARPVAQGVFPTIGRTSTGPDSVRSQDLPWRHRHVDLSNPEDFVALKSGFDRQTPLEIGLQDGGSDEQWLVLVAWLAAHRARIVRLLLYGEGMSPPSAAGIARWRRALGAADLPLFAATRGFFVEFNRSANEPTDAVSGLSFPLTATVHSDDPRTIAENVATIRDIAESARQLTPNLSMSIAPLALFHPPSLASGFPREIIAPWLSATLMYAAVAGVGSVTLADDVASMAPVSVLDRLLGCAHFMLTIVLSDQRSGLHAGLLHRSGEPTGQILAVNLNSVPALLELNAFPECVRSFRNVSDGVAVISNRTRVEIAAFGVCWVNCELD